MMAFLIFIGVVLVGMAIVAMSIWGPYIMEFKDFTNAFLAIIYFQMGKQSKFRSTILYRPLKLWRTESLQPGVEFRLHYNLLLDRSLPANILFHDDLYRLLPKSHSLVRISSA